MKQIKAIIITAIVTLLSFGAIVYTSCRKDPCKGVACLHGGACSGGNCVCPTGYVGLRCENRAITYITYQNNTFTDIYVTVDGVNAVIPAGGSKSFHGTYGDSFTGSAYTSGTTSSGAQVGLMISWDLSDSYPSSDQTVDLNVSSDYFFLKLKNISSVDITDVYVNYGLASETHDNILIPNDGYTYDVGYYDAWANSNLYLVGGTSYWSYDINLAPFSANNYYIFAASD